MNIQENVLLAPYTTFKIGGAAKFFVVVKHLDELKEAAAYARDNNLKFFILEGGSNVLISDNGFDGLVIKIELEGRKVVKEDSEHTLLKVAAGEVWDDVVALAVKKGWWGIENLSHIPGKTGAIAVQNVGAYGQEASQVVEEVEVYDTKDSSVKTLKNHECRFAYRSSIFNNQERGRYVILNVLMRLDKLAAPELSYRDLKQRFAGLMPTLLDIRDAVTAIRDQKFPFPVEAKNGNAGSFFKNTIVDEQTYEKVKNNITANFGQDAAESLERKKFVDGASIKIPSAFLLDICGMKSVANKHAKINANQPLVIVNATGKASAADVLDLAGLVLKSVKEKTGLDLKIEPELVGFSSEELNKYGIISK